MGYSFANSYAWCMDNTPRIRRIEWGRLEATRPRAAGSNARLGPHGQSIGVPIARITDSAGAFGFGWSRVSQGAAQALVDRPIAEAFSADRGATGPFSGIEYPLWDLAGRRAGLPVHALVGGGTATTLDVPCYDTSLYFDDLHIASDPAAAQLLAEEAIQGRQRGHRAFKIKVGRGARHLPPEAGLRRDVEIVRAVRRAVGRDAVLLADANNGFNLNLTKRFLAETAEAHLHWMEEPFHEDPVLLEDLQGWLRAQGLETVIADGEGAAAPGLMDWARRGLINVVQYDVFSPGFSRWLEIGRACDAAGAQSAPHHYGGLYGNYACGHLAAGIPGFAFVEWDEADAPGLDASAYRLTEGQVRLPAAPGFGLGLDEEVFAQAVRDGGFTVS